MTANAIRDGDRLISLTAAARRTGMSRWTILRRVHEGELPAFRTGRAANSPLRVRVRDVDAMLTPYEID